MYWHGNTPHPDPLPQGARELSLPQWEGLREDDMFSGGHVLSSFLQPPSSPFAKGDLVAGVL